jgi:hypothetical protein
MLITVNLLYRYIPILEELQGLKTVNIKLPENVKRNIFRRAKKLGVSVSMYFRQLAYRDLKIPKEKAYLKPGPK